MRRTAALLATALLATACAAGGDGAADDRPTDGTSASATGPAAADAAAGDGSAPDADEADDGAATPDGSGDAPEPPETLRWTASTLGGDDFAAADLAGGDTILWMWAPWCSVCEKEAPEVAAFLEELPDGVRVVGVAGRDDVGPMREFVERHGLQDMTTVVDPDGGIWATYGVTYQPAYVFIDAAGGASVAAGAIGTSGLLEGIEIAFG